MEFVDQLKNDVESQLAIYEKQSVFYYILIDLKASNVELYKFNNTVLTNQRVDQNGTYQFCKLGYDLSNNFVKMFNH
jgi:hypothetical protein